MATMSIDERARGLVGNLAGGCSGGNSIGSMTPACYDTAWVAMVSKSSDGQRKWVFPECYDFLLRAQLPSGGWCANGPDIDGIVTTLAALLAMKTRIGEVGVGIESNNLELCSRIDRAVRYLKNIFKEWRVPVCRNVGFEILVPALLSYLEKEGEIFQFPGRAALMALNAEKLAKSQPELLYGGCESTLIHSLEALIGKIDFDRVRHHKINGSLLASPSSTAAYLMNSSLWDDEAEQYLRTAVKEGCGRGTGGVPSAFPCTTFEVSWIMSTLLEHGFSSTTLGATNVSTVSDYLEKQLLQGKGLVGFAPNILADADDSAKSNLTLALLDKPLSVRPMIEKFEDVHHFRTYGTERNASFSANCNVLSVLLSSPDKDTYEKQIFKAFDFLCDAWWTGEIDDKWNLSPLYSFMLLAEAFTKLLRAWDQGTFIGMNAGLPQILLQIVIRTLHAQNSDGSWGLIGTCEETAYGILTLCSMSNLPWVSINCQVESAIALGRLYLTEHLTDWDQPAYVWIEKVTYGSAPFSVAYCLAAMKAKSSLYRWTDRVSALASLPMENINRISRFFSQLPLFSAQAEWKLQLSTAEGYLYLPRLRIIQSEVFTGGKGADDKYMEYLPSIWTTCNNLKGVVLPPKLLWEMIVISMLNYQADEYMETILAQRPEQDLQSLQANIRQLCQIEPCGAAIKFPHVVNSASCHCMPIKADINGSTEHFELRISWSLKCKPGCIIDINPPNAVAALVEPVLNAFVTRFKTHPAVLRASNADRLVLLHELETFLLAQISQNIDSRNIDSRHQTKASPAKCSYYSGGASPAIQSSPPKSFYSWVRSTSADHTSCPYAFAFYACLIAPRDGADCFASARAKFYAQDVVRHLASMCRMYNDYGSVRRDREERNLNSVDFPEFSDGNDAVDNDNDKGNGVGSEGGSNGMEDDGKRKWEEKKEAANKSELMQIAEYERECMGLAMRRLEEVVAPSTMQALDLFVDATDLFGQIYVARDIGVRTA